MGPGAHESSVSTHDAPVGLAPIGKMFCEEGTGLDMEARPLLLPPVVVDPGVDDVGVVEGPSIRAASTRVPFRHCSAVKWIWC